MTRFLCFAAASLGLTSCLGSGKDTCAATVLEPVQAAVGPKTASVNRPVNFLLTYLPQNTCSQLENVYEASGVAANTFIVGPRVRYTDCNCPVNTISAQTTYSFTPPRAGTYYLNFVASTPSGFITDTLVAQ